MAALALCVLAVPAFSMPNGNAEQKTCQYAMGADGKQMQDGCAQPMMGPQADGKKKCMGQIRSMLSPMPDGNAPIKADGDHKCMGPVKSMMGPQAGPEGNAPMDAMMGQDAKPDGKKKAGQIRSMMGPAGQQGPNDKPMGRGPIRSMMGEDHKTIVVLVSVSQ
ncbi:MAG: hypothetical protein HPY61_14520 [Methanotrichaceae archaeon]|nr:hypothetical protein [Methanotrichaceae archaeon]